MKGVLQISLDFELQWGVFESPRGGDEYFLTTVRSIAPVLETFANNRVAVTWACVGKLFLHDWGQWQVRQPNTLPSYSRRAASSFQFGDHARSLSQDPRSFFAPGLIQQIAQTPLQEIASHTYSHYYCLEPGQTVDQFKCDLQLAIQLGNEIGVQIESLVLPRNQFDPQYLKAMAECGIRSVRTNPDVWYWRKPNSRLLTKVARTADAYLPFRCKAVHPNKIVEQDGVLLQPASRFLRPHDPSLKGRLLNSLRTQRIKSEMTTAAKNGLVYHLWWHPHNFAVDVDASLKNLKEILQHFVMLRETFGMESHSMRSLREQVAGG